MSKLYRRLPLVYRKDMKNVKQLVQVNNCVALRYLVIGDSQKTIAGTEP